MSIATETSTTTASTASLVDKIAPHAPKILLGACDLGLISVFLPLATLSFGDFSTSFSVVQDWRGKLGLVAYVGVGVMAGMMLNNELAGKRSQILACFIATGVAALLAVWLMFSVSGLGVGTVSTGFGAFVNILAALAATGASAVLAKRAQII